MYDDKLIPLVKSIPTVLYTIAS